MMDDTERALSVRLYDVMENIGASEKIRKLYQDNAITNEIFHIITYQMNSDHKSLYMFGSSCEGTTTYDMHSDVDYVICYDEFPVIDDINTAPPGISFLMVRDDHTHQGYVKLQRVNYGRPQTRYNWKIADGFGTDSTGRVCFKHYSINSPNDERHGPADTTPEADGYVSTDNVLAFRCRNVPYFVTEWVCRRRRLNAWPTRINLKTMRGLGCFVVGVGHCTSREFDIEWRLSFSLQERLLLFSFNPTQHKCYIVLKMLKKEIIQQRIGESISSYHCKTCMFYAIENTNANLWKPHKLLTCVRVCLMILLTWVYNGYCPNYFIPSENMFERQCHREKKDELVQVLRELVSELPSLILHLQCDCVGRMVTDQTIHSQNIGIVQYTQYFNNFGSAIVFLNSINKICYENGDQRYNCLICLQISNIITRLNTTLRINEHTEKQTRDAILHVLPTLHLQLAQRLVSIAFTTESQPFCRTILQLCIQHFHKGQLTDLFTSKLLIVTLLMRLKYYKLCEEILEGAADSLKIHVISICRCFDKPHVTNDKLLTLLEDETISTKTFNESCVVTCVTFIPCDTEITPIPLRAEMFRSEDTLPGSRDVTDDYWFDWAVVDGKVYLYFLQYLVCSKLKRKAKKRIAIVNLVVVLTCDPNLHHRDTGYNLLGWIYVQEGQHQDAIRCFQTSWKIRPHHNAAKFHIKKVPLDLD